METLALNEGGGGTPAIAGGVGEPQAPAEVRSMKAGAAPPQSRHRRQEAQAGRVRSMKAGAAPPQSHARPQ